MIKYLREHSKLLLLTSGVVFSFAGFDICRIESALFLFASSLCSTHITEITLVCIRCTTGTLILPCKCVDVNGYSLL